MQSTVSEVQGRLPHSLSITRFIRHLLGVHCGTCVHSDGARMLCVMPGQRKSIRICLPIPCSPKDQTEQVLSKS